MLPDALRMGIDEKTFWELTPRKFKIYSNAYSEKLKEKDRFNWQLGAYVMQAVSVSLDHAFNGYKARSEYPEKPFCEQGEDEYIDASNWTEEQKEEARMKLFGYLGELQETHERAEKQKEALKSK